MPSSNCWCRLARVAPLWLQLPANFGPTRLGELAAQLATGQRMGGRVALPAFQKLTYAALGKAL